MAQTKHDIQAILQSAGTHPRHRFGQNFMIDQNLVRLIADAGGLEPGDHVLEVGPGTGTLTEAILEKNVRLLAVEIDRDLAGSLRERMGSREGFQIIEADALDGKHTLCPAILAATKEATEAGRPLKLVANLPYNIASPLVIELLIAGAQSLTFTVQKEVADRLKAPAGSEAYGPLSVMAQLLSRVQVVRTLPPQAFWPAPTIDSALVRMDRQDQLGERASAMGTFVHSIFSYRRKTMKQALSRTLPGMDAEALLAQVGIEKTLRPEMITPEQLHQLFIAGQGQAPAK